MIDFQPIKPEHKELYEPYLQLGQYGCERSFVNQCLWGRQKAAFIHGYLAFFSQFCCKSIYPFPVGCKNIKPVLDAIMEDAVQRGISCRFTSLTAADRELLENL